MKRRFDIVIAGAGMVGLLTANLVARSRHAARLGVTVIDAGPRPVFDPDEDVGMRVSAISIGSAELLERAGAWAGIRNTRIGPFLGMRVWDAGGAADGPDALCFDAADFAVPELGYIVENALIRHELLAALAETDVELRFAAPIESVAPRGDAGGCDVRLDSGELLHPDLLIGADGAASRVRKGIGIPVRTWAYPQHAFVTHVRPQIAHREIAYQRFLPNGPIALLPLADGRASVVWSTTPERVREAQHADASELARMLAQASDHVLGALSVEGPRGSFPLRAQHALRYVEPGLVLVGDAAHCVHPLAGQGANLGFADAASLAEIVDAAMDAEEYPGDLPTLRRYERDRRSANATMLHFIDSINRLFLSDRGFLPGFRRRGMQFFNRSGPIRRKAVEVALGIRF